MKPILMGAMMGAGMGLVQGKDPLKSALIGGATAGIGDKLMGAGGLFDVGSEALGAGLGEVATSAYPEALLGSATGQGVNQATTGMLSEGMSPFTTLPSYANATTQSIAPNLWDQGVKQVGDVMDQGVDLVDSNSLGLGMQAYKMSTEETPPIQPRTAPQVLSGNYATRDQPVAINVPRPNSVYSKQLAQADDYAKRYRG